MIIFWMAAAVLVAAALGLIMLRARDASVAGEQADPARGLYHRQLDEIDELAERGLIAPDERDAAFSEAARRLVRSPTIPAPSSVSINVRLGVVAAAIATALGALLIYALAGSSGRPDQPFAKRLAGWQAMDPRRLDPASMAAVLGDLARQNPNDGRLQLFLGKARLAASDMSGAAEAFRRSSRLSPSNPEPLILLGEALTRANGKVTPEATGAFQRASNLDPSDPSARFFLGQAAVDAGDVPTGVAAWRGLLADLPSDDPRRDYLDEQIKIASAGVSDETPQGAMIRGMVERQAAKLQQSPNDPEGWARLVRSYGVLGDVPAQTSALAQARVALKGQPAALAKVEAEAAGTARPRP